VDRVIQAKKTCQARRLAETGERPEYEQASRDLRLGDRLRAIRRLQDI
jgi:hypothetical protein